MLTVSLGEEEELPSMEVHSVCLEVMEAELLYWEGVEELLFQEYCWL